ncbi:hypothetical protein CEXT_12861 [Caerostris extrusa]|uniref:Immunoglobulin I-set domain-containing protein n=1 Tax=Caerostris extrusa TaxID=172846 RepID=A0AAV4XEI6_CAEEX|nr:hypothetical protein CEXT_12861 [Caerostris extrusa]
MVQSVTGIGKQASLMCLQKSVQGHVYLTKTDLDTEGVYRCEASAESPTFQTVEAENTLKCLSSHRKILKS